MVTRGFGRDRIGVLRIAYCVLGRHANRLGVQRRVSWVHPNTVLNFESKAGPNGGFDGLGRGRIGCEGLAWSRTGRIV